MGHTNSTANLALPQFVGSDKPTWLGDINGAFSDIDAYVGTNDAAVAAAASDASSAISQASAAVSTANNANTTAGNASTVANNAIGVANNAVAIAGVVDGKVGLLADLNTTDRTSIVNAINEVYDITIGADEVSVTADGVKTYAQILADLFGAIDVSKINAKSRMSVFNSGSNATHYQSIVVKSTSEIAFSEAGVASADGAAATVYTLGATGKGEYGHGTTYNDFSSSVPASGFKFTVIY